MSDTKPGRTDDRRAVEAKKPNYPGAGPHARKDLTNYDLTPGTGSLPGPEDDDSQDTVSS